MKKLKLLATLLAAVLMFLCLSGCLPFVLDFADDGAVQEAEAIPKIAIGTTDLSEDSDERVIEVSELLEKELVADDYRGDYHYLQLKDNEKTVYKAFEYALEEGCPYIYVGNLITDNTDTLEKVFEYLALDSPLVEQNFSYATGTFTTYYEVGEMGRSAELSGVYICIKNFTDLHWSKKCEAVEKAKEIVNKMPSGLDEGAKAEYLYKYARENVAYKDYGDSDVENEHFLYDGLINGKTHCDGSANMYSLLLNLAGLECFEKLYNGTEEVGHTWCTAKIDGDWYNIDATSGENEDKDFKEGIMRNFAVEDKLQSYPPETNAVYPVCSKNLRFELISVKTAEEDELVKNAKDIIKKAGYVCIYVEQYDEDKMEEVAQSLANSLKRTVNWQTTDALNNAKVVMFK